MVGQRDGRGGRASHGRRWTPGMSKATITGGRGELDSPTGGSDGDLQSGAHPLRQGCGEGWKLGWGVWS